MSFIERLYRAAEQQQSWLCVGLDPDPARTPPGEVLAFCRRVVEATADLVCAFKPNLAFFEAAGLEGLEALVRLRDLVPPAVPIIGDAKRGDIGSTAQAYARALFEVFRFDAATVSPYLGADTLEPFLGYHDRGVFVLVKTSNPGSGDLQDLPQSDGRPLYEHVARLAQQANHNGNVGLVVGATYPKQLAEVRRLCPELPFLIPGVGAQGGDLEAVMRVGPDARGRGAIVNSSRGVIYAGSGDRHAAAARAAAQQLRDAVNAGLAARAANG